MRMLRVLLVDDEQHIHYLMTREVNWAAHGYELSGHAENGRQALEALSAPGARYDVLLTDLNMPVMDGFELIREVAKRMPTTVLVVLSVYNDHANIREAFRLGADDYILKYEIEDGYVIKTLDNALRARRADEIAFFDEGAAEGIHNKPGDAPPNPERAAKQWCGHLLCGSPGDLCALNAAWQHAFNGQGGWERSQVQDFYLRVVYAVRDRLARDGLDEAELAALCAGEGILTCNTMREITQHMDALGGALSRLIEREGDTRNHRLIARAARYIDDHLAEHLTLHAASGHVGLNASYFSKLFQETRGQSFSQYVTQKRIEAAKKMLMAMPGAKIYEIACDCGFSSVEHFSRTFKREVGVSPIQYKLIHPAP